eukprot:TRINITY_DN1193_c0_g2_i1.p1 TRINITY_DN1193_c0_g2~~TRINITY_DN1193_c0_g2_i1.p1  ORF type:complete len:113 (+),score=3.73 TRINITY_DN1193_c0_g2_i1:241-579(+)
MSNQAETWIGVAGATLLTELMENENYVPKFNDAQVSIVTSEVKYHYEFTEQLISELEEDPEANASLKGASLIHHASCQRNKRCLLAYQVEFGFLFLFNTILSFYPPPPGTRG